MRQNIESKFVHFLASKMQYSYWQNLIKCELIFRLYVKESIDKAKNSQSKSYVLKPHQTASGEIEVFNIYAELIQ